MNTAGIIIGFACIMIIGIFHPIVIKFEYYFTSKVWPVFLMMGLAGLGASLVIENDVVSGIAGVFGVCSLWSIHEVKKQSERVAKGWFPSNPRRK